MSHSARLASTVFLLVLSAFCFGQSNTGFQPFGSFSSPGPDIINLANLNVHLTIPVVHKAGRGMPFNYNLSYDGTVWSVVGTTKNGTTTYKWGFSPGWTGLSLNGSIVGGLTYYTFGFVPNVEVCNDTVYTYTDPAGTSHTFGASNVSYDAGCGPKTGTTTTTDGSGYLLTLSGGTDGGALGNPATVVSLYDSSGNLINVGALIGSITDPNGNAISVNSAGSVTDTLGMTVLSLSGTSPAVFSYAGPGGSTQHLQVNYTSQTVATNFG